VNVFLFFEPLWFLFELFALALVYPLHIPVKSVYLNCRAGVFASLIPVAGET